MRCACCDSNLESPKFNRQVGKWEYCGTCLEIIFDVFHEFPDDHETGDAEYVEELYEDIEETSDGERSEALA